MGRAPCCSKVGLQRGPWTATEDTLLVNYIKVHGEGHWRSLPKKAGLLRCGKSCRLRWMNYLRPDIKRGNITPDEDDLIIRLHSLLGNRWSLIAKRLPGRTDNEIKNYWNCHLSKRVKKSEKSNSETSMEASTGSNRKAKRSTDKKQKITATPTVTTTKVHQPKASRVSQFWVIPRISSFDSMISGSSSCGSEGIKGANDAEVFDFPAYWSSIAVADATNHRRNAMICDEDQEFPWYGFDDSAAACLDATVVEDDSKKLDNIFEEYQQLLKGDDNGEIDSFFDSLLI